MHGPNLRDAYRGLTARGALEARRLTAASAEEASRLARQSGLDVVEVRASGVSLTLFPARRHFDLALFAHELIALLRAGLSLIEALETLAERQQEAGQDHAVLAELVRRMREGQSFSQALQAFPECFPELFAASIAASEQTGEMQDALMRYVRYHEQVGAIRQKIVSASLYPALLMLVGAGVGLFLLCFLVPRFSHVYEGLETELPLASRLLLQWGLFAGEHALLVSLGALGAVLALVLAVRHPDVQARLLGWLQRSRWIGAQLRLMQLSRFYRSLGLLLRGGIPALKALRLLRAGERNGQVADMLEQVATFHDKEVGPSVTATGCSRQRNSIHGRASRPCPELLNVIFVLQ